MTLPGSLAPETAVLDVFEPVCPYLGLASDPATHFAFPSSAQRCHASTRPSSVESAKQARDCLSEAHVTCSRYHPPAPSPSGMVVALAAVTAEASQRSGGGHAPVRRTVNTVLAIFLAIVAAIGGVVLGSRLAAVVNIGAAGAGESPTAGESAAPAPAATAPPTPAPRATPSPAPTPTASPAPTATPAPTASPKPSRTPSPTPSLLTHRVKRGETLTIIAAKYGVTVTALQRANGIKNPSLIITGQLLVIPAH